LLHALIEYLAGLASHEYILCYGNSLLPLAIVGYQETSDKYLFGCDPVILLISIAGIYAKVFIGCHSHLATFFISFLTHLGLMFQPQQDS
jgi:hypothetical protein